MTNSTPEAVVLDQETFVLRFAMRTVGDVERPSARPARAYGWLMSAASGGKSASLKAEKNASSWAAASVGVYP
jgi:hypothetical protein